MRRITTQITWLIAIAGMTAIAGVAEAQLPRSTQGGPPAGGTVARNSIPIPRYPYAGAWTGSLTLRAEAAPVSIEMRFLLADAATQSYSGETITGTNRTPSTHQNFKAAPAATSADANIAASTNIIRRTPPADASAASSGPSATAASQPAPTSAAEAIFVSHPTYGPLLCETSGRCADMPVLKWEEKSASGETLSYSAKLAGADSLAGTVTRAGVAIGTFSLRRE